MFYLVKHWPTKITASKIRQPYYQEEALTMVSDCLTQSDHVVISKNLKTKVPHQLNTDNPRMTGMKATTRS